jgi:hypothetical protein
MSLSTTFNYDTPSNFTFDPLLVSMSSGSAKLLQAALNVSFQSLINITATGNSITKTSGTPSAYDSKARSVETIASTGFVTFKSSASAIVAGLSNVDTAPNYTDIAFGINLFAGQTYIIENGVGIAGPLTAFSPSDTFKINVTAGVVTYYQNGTLLYTSLATPSFPLFFSASIFDIGTTISAVQMEYTLFNTANPTITTNSFVDTTDILSFMESVTTPSGSAVQYLLLVMGVPTYWSGSAWVTSDGTYAQSNDAATINSNLSTLGISLGTRVKLVAFLHSTGAVTPTLTSNTLTYNFFVQPSPLPDQCTVYVRINDFLNHIPADGLLIVTLPKPFYSNERVVVMDTHTVMFDVDGYAEVSVDESASAQANYNFSITYTDSTAKARSITFKPCQVPDLVDVALTAITTVAAVT